MKKYFLSLICLLLLSSSTIVLAGSGAPGSSYINLQKYWWYRYRLVNDFMKIGWNCGESMPAQARNLQYWDGASSGRIEWSDATIDLGNYIAMLATEHRMLGNNSLVTNRTDMELFFALNAFERLDRNAEIYCRDIDGTYPCLAYGDNLNGFFIRDDVPFTTLVKDNKTHFNRPGVIHACMNDFAAGCFSDRTNVSTSTPPVTASWGHSVARMPTEESADQTVQLAMGFALASKLTSGTTYSVFGGSTDLGDMAGKNLHNMIDHIANSSLFCIYSGGWEIINPTTNNCVYGIFPGSPTCANGGAFYQELAFGASQACDYWSGGRGGFGGPYKTVWEAMQFVPTHHDANFWGTYGALTEGSWHLLHGDHTWNRMKTFSTVNNNCSPHLPYLYRVMTGNGEPFRIGQTIELLDAAPGCGIHNYRGDCSNYLNPSTGIFQHNSPASWNWSGNNLIHEWYKREGGSAPTDDRDWNGLDYMVLFNLINLQFDHPNDYLRYYFNSYYKENFNENYPSTTPLFPTPIGSSTARLTLNFLEYVSTSSKINNDGNLTLRCAKAIDLIPGFETKGASSFLAHIEDYSINCGDYEHNDENGGHHYNTPGESYHYAELNGDKQILLPPWNNLLPNQGGSGDTTIVLDFPPGGVTYTPDSSIHSGNEPTDSITCAEEHAIFDSLVAEIYASGDQVQIDYLDSVIIPNASFPACDSTGDTSSGGGSNFRLANVDTTGGQSSFFNVYPNPNNGHFTFAFNNSGNYDISLVNALGAEVFRTHVYGRRSEVVHIDGLIPGIYIAVVVNNSGPQNRQIRKVIVDR